MPKGIINSGKKKIKGRPRDMPGNTQVKERIRLVKIELAKYAFQPGDVLFMTMPLKPKSAPVQAELGKQLKALRQLLGVPVIILEENTKLSVVNRANIPETLIVPEEGTILRESLDR